MSILSQGKRVYHEMGFDPSRQQIVLFGGQATDLADNLRHPIDTWEYGCGPPDFYGTPTRGKIDPATGQFPVTFTALGSDPAGSYGWNFGDGTPVRWGREVTHNYTKTGAYTVTLSVQGDPCVGDATAVHKSYIHVVSGTPASMITGVGADPKNPNNDTVRGFWYNSLPPRVVPSDISFQAYGSYGSGRPFGANVAAGIFLPGDLRPYIATGPGPSAGDAGALVKVFRATAGNAGLGQVYAYGTFHYGVNVADLVPNIPLVRPASMILSGAGPGSRFGPHVRAWDYTGNAVPGISFFAYPCVGFGVNVAGAQFDPIGIEKILTGPGPGAGRPSRVRGFEYVTNTTTPFVRAIAGIDFHAYGRFDEYGAKVGAGDIDGDGNDEILTGRGAGPSPWGDDTVKAFDYPNLTQMGSGNAFGFGLHYGVNVAAGDIGAPGHESVLAAQGPDPSAPPDVRALRYDPAAPQDKIVNYQPDINFAPWGDLDQVKYGATIAWMPPTPAGVRQPPVVVTRTTIQALRSMVSALPDSGTTPPTICQGNPPPGSVWSSDQAKQDVLAILDGLLVNLRDLDVGSILAALTDARNRVADTLSNTFARDEFFGLLDALVAEYQTGGYASGAVVALGKLDALGGASLAGTSPVVPDTAYLVSVYRPRGPAPFESTISSMSLSSMTAGSDLILEGTITDLAISVPAGKAYTIRSLQVAKPSCPPSIPNCERIIYADQESLDLDSTPPSSQVVLGQPVFEHQTFEALLLTPSLATPSLPAKAYISAVRTLPPTYPCPGGSLGGDVYVVEDLTALPASPITRLKHDTPYYRSMVLSPVPGDARIFASYKCGLDIIDTATDTITEQAITGFGGDRLKAAEVAPGFYRLFALDKNAEIVTSYDPVAGAVTGRVPAPLGVDIDITPDGRTLALLASDGTLMLFDSSDLLLTRTVAVGRPYLSPARLALTAEGDRALVVDATDNVVEVVEIASPSLVQWADNAATVIASLPDAAFLPPAGFRADRSIDAARRGFRGGGDSGEDDDDDGDDDDDDDTPAGHRKALVKKLDKAAREVAKAERETEPEERDEHFAKALKTLKKKVLVRMDGYLGGDPKDDWILTQEHQALAAPLVYRLINAIEREMSPPTGTPEVL